MEQYGISRELSGRWHFIDMPGPNLRPLYHIPLCRHSIMVIHLKLVLGLIKPPPILNNHQLKHNIPHHIHYANNQQNIGFPDILRTVHKNKSLYKEVGNHNTDIHIPLPASGEEGEYYVPDEEEWADFEWVGEVVLVGLGEFLVDWPCVFLLWFQDFPVDWILLIIVIVYRNYLVQRVLYIMRQLPRIVLIRLQQRQLRILLSLIFVFPLRHLLIVH